MCDCVKSPRQNLGFGGLPSSAMGVRLARSRIRRTVVHPFVFSSMGLWGSLSWLCCVNVAPLIPAVALNTVYRKTFFPMVIFCLVVLLTPVLRACEKCCVSLEGVLQPYANNPYPPVPTFPVSWVKLVEFGWSAGRALHPNPDWEKIFFAAPTWNEGIPLENESRHVPHVTDAKIAKMSGAIGGVIFFATRGFQAPKGFNQLN